jgi:predicted amidohydrolase
VKVVSGLDLPLSTISKPKSPVGLALLELLAISDEACSPLINKPELTDATLAGEHRERVFAELVFDTEAHWILLENGQRSICREIHVSRLRVLPKFRAPQRGLTLRSLSLFAGIAGSELDARFFDNRQVKEDLTLNLLILPWPLAVNPTQFRLNKRLQKEMGNMAEGFGFFTYEGRPATRRFFHGISQLLRLAEKETGKVSIVVLPELALSTRDAARLRRLLARSDCGLVTGVGSAGKSGRSHGTNRVQLYMPGLVPVEQGKHHRWKLDRSQIIQYSLGNSLYHEKLWWEHIDISDRRLSFLRLTPWLTLCVLICEDLARPDPAGDVVRAVGPNLVISLLMDGPQLSTRWASRHATTLAEDPGSSVLTVTSLGMSQLSRSSTGAARSKVIGLWKEEGSSSVEIELPAGHHAAVLSVSMKACLDWAADGRNRVASIPSLTGVRFLKATELEDGA